MFVRRQRGRLQVPGVDVCECVAAQCDHGFVLRVFSSTRAVCVSLRRKRVFPPKQQRFFCSTEKRRVGSALFVQSHSLENVLGMSLAEERERLVRRVAVGEEAREQVVGVWGGALREEGAEPEGSSVRVGVKIGLELVGERARQGVGVIGSGRLGPNRRYRVGFPYL